MDLQELKGKFQRDSHALSNLLPTPNKTHLNLTPICGLCGIQIQPTVKFSALVRDKEDTSVRCTLEGLPFPADQAVHSAGDFSLCRWSKCKTKNGPEVVSLHDDCLDVYCGQYAKTKKAVAGTRKTVTAPSSTSKTTAIVQKITTTIVNKSTAKIASTTNHNAVVSEALERLWQIATFRQPWAKAPPMFLFEDENPLQPLHYDASSLVNLGLSKLDSMPPEIMLAIRKDSAGSPLWKLNKVVDVAQFLATYSAGSDDSSHGNDDNAGNAKIPPSLPISDIVSWSRLGKLVVRHTTDGLPADTAEKADADGFVRLTIDAEGLKHIEHLSERPPYSGKTYTGKRAFVVTEANALKGVTVHFKFGRARLVLPKTCPGLQTWNTPEPPSLSDCAFYKKYPVGGITPSSCLFLVDLADPALTGLTFFFDGGPVAIHPHTASEPTARLTCERFSANNTQWLYMPLAPGDRIEAVGVRQENYAKALDLTVMFRKHLSGDSLVGFSYYDAPAEVVLTKPDQQSRALVYTKSDQSRLIGDIGVYNEPASPDVAAAALATAVTTQKGIRRKCFPRSAYSDDHLTSMPYQSNVPLTDTVRIKVFRLHTANGGVNNGYVNGMIFTYANGCQRAIGMCCLGEDNVGDENRLYDSQEYNNPVRIWYASDMDECTTKMRIETLGEGGDKRGDQDEEGGEDDDDDDDEEEWMSCELTGRLEWAVDQALFVVSHEAGDEDGLYEEGDFPIQF